MITQFSSFRFKNNTRRSCTFSNDKMRQIERENQILLNKILYQRSNHVNMSHENNACRISSAAINRRNRQEQIDLDNNILQRKLEKIERRNKKTVKFPTSCWRSHVIQKPNVPPTISIKFSWCIAISNIFMQKRTEHFITLWCHTISHMLVPPSENNSLYNSMVRTHFINVFVKELKHIWISVLFLF